MAWTSTALLAAETAALALDRTVLIATTAVDNPALLAEWNTDGGGFAQADRSDPDFPAFRATDRIGLRQTRGDAAITSADWRLLLDANRASAEFDCCAILNHNLTDLDGLQIQFQRADDTAFSTNLATITTITAAPADRLIVFFANRFTGGGYLRLRIIATENFVPEIGEVWFGRRRQFRTGVRPGSDINALSSTLAISAGVGAELATEMALGRIDAEVAFTPKDDVAELRDTDTVRAFWRESAGGTRPFLWVPRPISEPNNVRLVSSADTGLSMPNVNFSNRTFARKWRELPPFVSAA